MDAIRASISEKQNQIKEAENEKKKVQSDLTNVKKIVSSLKDAKQDLEYYVTQLDGNLSDVQDKITQLNGLIVEKEKDIEQSEKDLAEAERIQKDQYESMKKRIRFMYEKGNGFYLDLIFGSSTFGEMLNKADYIEQMSAYEKKKLDEFKDTCLYLDSCRQGLESDKELLEAAKAQVEAEEDNLQQLISAKEQEISNTSADISNKEAAIAEYEADIAARNAIIAALEQAIAEENRKLEESGGTARKYDGGMFQWPAPSYTRISDDYGYRIHPTLGITKFHNGVDMAAPGGSPILAAYEGEVVAADYNSSMGNYIMINHGDGLYTIYMHASALYVSKGQTVSKGDKIGAVGTTGRSTGNHLHFGVRKDGVYVSPWNYLSK
ncbi:MAG: peptidoglycan DD-metalloendopeptidase family protein [Lachnospiraceae bacterium]|nr:peptidoglycan DD-metalloendopeptidase family protein [Lachnospiraceae bacterium]